MIGQTNAVTSSGGTCTIRFNNLVPEDIIYGIKINGQYIAQTSGEIEVPKGSDLSIDLTNAYGYRSYGQQYQCLIMDSLSMDIPLINTLYNNDTDTKSIYTTIINTDLIIESTWTSSNNTYVYYILLSSVDLKVPLTTILVTPGYNYQAVTKYINAPDNYTWNQFINDSKYNTVGLVYVTGKGITSNCNKYMAYWSAIADENDAFIQASDKMIPNYTYKFRGGNLPPP